MGSRCLLCLAFVQFTQNPQMRLQTFQCFLLHELAKVLIKMAMVIVPVLRVVKVLRRIGKVLHRFPDAHDLQRFFTAQAGGAFKIPVQGAGGNFIPGGKILHLGPEIILCIAMR